MTLLWSFDPGEATGWACGKYGPNTPYYLMDRGIIQGGLEGFIEWWWRGGTQPMTGDTLVSESFRLNPGNEFVANLTPVAIEGALAACWADKIHWQPRSAKVGVPDALLKAHGLWTKGEDVNWEDGRDANDAIIHGIEYLRSNSHVPTLRKYFKED